MSYKMYIREKKFTFMFVIYQKAQWVQLIFFIFKYYNILLFEHTFLNAYS